MTIDFTLTINPLSIILLAMLIGFALFSTALIGYTNYLVKKSDRHIDCMMLMIQEHYKHKALRHQNNNRGVQT